MQLVNLTPHRITLFTPATANVGEEYLDNPDLPTIEPTHPAARVAEVRTYMPDLKSEGDLLAMVSTVTYGEVTGLPEPQEGVAYVVSAMVRAAVPDRLDVYSHGPAVRRCTGEIVGCVGLTANTPPKGAHAAPRPRAGSVS